MYKITIIPYFILLFFLFDFKGNSQNSDSKREFRAAWIVTGKNIDYPSSKNLTTAQQKAEFISILDLLKKNGLNAIIMQIRPASDAFYPSAFEPWSEWLTGVQGKAPEPYYDPLAFMIEETHKRDMEFHAWFNPFRAVFTIKYANVAKNHISNTRPDWMITYGLHRYFDPGIPAAREWVTKVILDVVKRYNIEGVHFDDYFYPYPEPDENKKFIDFPDDNSFKLYKGSFTNKPDWRRNNIDRFIEYLNKNIKAIKPWVKFGVGPTGIWRNSDRDPQGSNTRGFACYDYLYADVLKWVQNGWVDYVSPQIYWQIGNKGADYRVVVDWWNKNANGRHIYVGHAYYRSGEEGGNNGWKNPSEMPNQIRYLRSFPNIKGSIFYNTSTIKKNTFGFNDSLRNNFYKTQVMTPIMHWLDTIPPTPPLLSKARLGKEIFVTWTKSEFDTGFPHDTAAYYKIYKFPGLTIGDLKDNQNIYKITKDDYFIVTRSKRFILFGKKYTYVVTAIDGYENESQPGNAVIIKIKE